MKVYLGSDHAGFEHKEIVKNFLKKKSYDICDLGPKEFDADDDYPDFIRPVAEHVSADHVNSIKSFGIIFGGSGQGEAIVANRVQGVRCAVYYGGDSEIITLSRQHNDANILSLGAHFITTDDLETIIDLWLSTEFSGDERHMRRIVKIDQEFDL
jgi:ribose 5-phosphate isomerase B